MRVLIVSQYFHPEIGATQTRMFEFARALIEQGHRVDVLTEFPNHPSGIIPPTYRWKMYEVDRTHPFLILRVWVLTSPRKSFWTRLGFYGTFFLMAVLASLRLPMRFDVVVATSPPLPVAAAGLVISRLKGAAFLMDVRDLWPRAALALKELTNPGLYALAEWVEHKLYRKAARITATTEAFCQDIRDRVPEVGERLVHVPNGTLDDIFSPARGDAGLRDRLGMGDKFVVTYAGLFGIAQDLSTVLAAAERLNDNPSIEFLLIGEGPEKEKLMSESKRRSLNRLRFLAQVPLHESAHYLNASDALLVPLAPDPIFDMFVPSKLYDALACAKPVILSVNGEARAILERAGAGVFVEPGNPDALAATILQMSKTPDQARAMGARGREFVRRYYLRTVQSRRFSEIVAESAAHRRSTSR